jgi:hypothetical protein
MAGRQVEVIVRLDEKDGSFGEVHRAEQAIAKRHNVLAFLQSQMKTGH